MADMHETICRCLSEQANQGIFATDGGLTITSWNRWLELHSGRTTSQMVGCGLLEAYPDLVDRGLDRVYQEALSGRSVMLSQRFHRYLLPMPSAVHDMETASAPHMLQSARISPLTENGRVVGTLTLIEDVTERAVRDSELEAHIARLWESEKLLRKERNFISAVLDTAGALVVVLDRDGGIVRFNHACEKTTGYSFEEVKDRRFWEIFLPSEEMERVMEVFKVLQAGRFPNTIENHWLTKNKARRLISWSNTALLNDDGQVEYLVGIGIDITTRREMEKALEISRKELAERVVELEARNREIGLIGEMGNRLQAAREMSEAYGELGHFLPRIFREESGALFVPKPSGNRLEAVAFWGEASGVPRVLSPDECQALLQGSVQPAQEPAQILPCGHLECPISNGYVCIPLTAQGDTVGLLYLRRKGAGPEFSASRRHLARTVAEHTALALSNLKLRDTLKEQSIRDPLTGLFNRRYMEESLDREISRAARNQSPLGVVMLDIDHFKRFNDLHGHQAGDALLRELGSFLLAAVRAGDIACRYGGEEFTLILPDAPAEAVIRRAEWIRDRAKTIDVQQQGLSLGPVSLSLGVAVFPEHGATRDELIRNADNALYRAKANGRDCVEMA